MRFETRRVVALLAASLAVVAVGCGEDESEESSEERRAPCRGRGGHADRRRRGGYTFELSETPTAETKSVVFDNQGRRGTSSSTAEDQRGLHARRGRRARGQEGLRRHYAEGGADPGESKTFEITKPIEPGNYAMLCPIGSPEGPHYELGQLEEFEIG